MNAIPRVGNEKESPPEGRDSLCDFEKTRPRRVYGNPLQIKKRADGSASLVSETPSRTAAGRLKGLAETYPARVTDRARSVPRTSKKMETTFKHTIVDGAFAGLDYVPRTKRSADEFTTGFAGLEKFS